MSTPEVFPATEQGEILLIEDNPGDARIIREMLREIDALDGDVAGDGDPDGSRLRHVDRLSPGLEHLEAEDPAVVLLDLNLPDSKGLDTLDRVLEAGTTAPVIVLTGVRDRAVGVEALDRGAQGYLVKGDVDADQLLRSIYHAIERDRYERHLERQRDRLTALNALTQELLEAETDREIADRVVDAARAGLQLPWTVVALYDDEEGRLQPAAVTDGDDRSIDVASLLDPEGGAAWRAFVEGETVRAADQPSLPSPGAIVPLGRHGVLVTGLPHADEFGAQRDFVDLLTANVRAALDRAARERTLRERDRTLREQNERLERLNRINGVIRDIDQALVRAGSRAEIERAVCTQLTTAGPYAFAWIGERDPIGDGLEPRASSGDDDGFLAAIAGDGDSADARPTALAAETRDPQVVDDLLGDPPLPAWRQAALGRGYRACIALPVAYRDVLYGVLEVYATQTGTFGELERTVLAELGETVGYAINAVESKRALVSDEFVEVEFLVRDPSIPLLALTTEVGCRVELESVIARSGGGYRVFFTARGATADAVLGFLQRAPGVEETRLVADRAGEGLFECTVDESSFVGTLLDHGAVPQEFTAEDGEGRVAVALPESADVRTFLGMVKTAYADSEMVARRERTRPRGAPADFTSRLDEVLTDRQREVLHTAFESGFFESPRASTGSEVGDALGISQPTFNNHLRAAQRKLLELVFDDDAGGDP